MLPICMKGKPYPTRYKDRRQFPTSHQSTKKSQVTLIRSNTNEPGNSATIPTPRSSSTNKLDQN
ncbi:hypothetical protein HDU81_009024 [Chytriomyces hyalinus]|nr:hypothetical protein HDU81_009024 [Chytriomyces hyalinus]